ncbi:MAG: SGNH/GDSL hydrolase family protein, partial [Planctomycetota bacterium]|nr:SGNH/GDSL hydrolase family protein [Planctomycetota bacterium]
MTDKSSPKDPEPEEQNSDDQEPRKPSPKLVRVFKILTILFSLVFALVIGEILARAFTSDYYLQTRKSDGGLLIPFEPNTSAELVMDEFQCRYDINQWGYRDKRDRSEKKPSGKKRLVMLGDSFSAGWGVEFDEIYSTRLENQLGVEIINGAKNGGCALWYIHQARYAAPKFQADALIVQVFDNDLIDCERSKKDLEVVDGKAIGPLPEDL